MMPAPKLASKVLELRSKTQKRSEGSRETVSRIQSGSEKIHRFNDKINYLINSTGESMNTFADGQLYWAIKKGSAGMGMIGFPGLSKNQIWQLIHYIRTLSQ